MSKTYFRRLIILFFLSVFLLNVSSVFATPDPKKMLEEMDQVIRGNSHKMTVLFDIKTKRWSRNYKIDVWMKGVDDAFARVLDPPKTAGQGFLRLKTRLWQYLPTAERTILIPPSLMLDNFLGSDFSNDDFVKLSYFPRDYESKILGEEEMDSFKTYHLELLPHSDAPVTYGKLELWLRTSDSAPVRWDFYNEKMEPIRTLHYSEFKTFGKKEVPTIWKMENLKEKDRKTTVTMISAEYDIPIEDDFFSRKNLEQYP